LTFDVPVTLTRFFRKTEPTIAGIINYFSHLDNSAIRKIVAKIKRIKTTIERLIQMGDNTHHQDQVITLVSLRPMNRIVSAPVKLIPLEDVDDEDDIVLERDCLIAFCSMRSISLLISLEDKVSDTVQKVVQSILILFLSVEGTETNGARKGTLRSTDRPALLFGVTFLNQLSDVRIGSHGRW
jgi:hypothetical protein